MASTDEPVILRRTSNLQLESGLPELSHVVLDTLWHGNAQGTVREAGEWRSRCDVAVVVIDSMPPDNFIPTEQWPVPDLIVTPYLNAERFREPPGNCRWLQGAQYALLDTAYHSARVVDPASDACGILISCGGSDPDRLSQRLLQIMAAGQQPVDVVVGPLFDSTLIQELQTICRARPHLKLHYQPQSLASLIAGSQLVVGRPGLLRYEAAALGRPALYLARGEDYRNYYEGFQEAGLAEFYFESDADGEQNFLHRAQALSEYATSVDSWRLNDVAHTAVDALGAQRVLKHILDTPARRH
jgi:spore coat polysaccharide biosynthesis predicted glycosyltransferase SpsG